MERVCSHCHAVIAAETDADWCPACGGAIIDPPGQTSPGNPEDLSKALFPPTVDHRGIVLPRRHAVGGIITPQ